MRVLVTRDLLRPQVHGDPGAAVAVAGAPVPT
jgi:hypothetical protein